MFEKILIANRPEIDRRAGARLQPRLASGVAPPPGIQPGPPGSGRAERVRGRVKPTAFAGSTTPTAATVRSPCVSICRLDVDSGYCEGCYRTIEEIADWGMMTDDRKRQVWQALRQRRASQDPVMPTPAPAPDLPPRPA